MLELSRGDWRNTLLSNRDFMIERLSRAFHARYLCVLGFVVLIVGGAQFSTSDQSPGASAVPLPVFTDITQQAGLNMKIIDGDETTEYLIDVNGEGACFLDYNNDGYQDIFLVNGSSRKSEAQASFLTIISFATMATGRLLTSPRGPIWATSGWHSGCAVGDYNNDGFADIYRDQLRPQQALSQQW